MLKIKESANILFVYGEELFQKLIKCKLYRANLFFSMQPMVNAPKEKIELEKVCDNEYNKSILKFLKVASEQWDKEELENMLNNLHSLKIKTTSEITYSYYDIRKNEIGITEAGTEHIYHELFHMASTHYTNNGSWSGFWCFKKGRINIGRALTEGYTEALTAKYFNDYSAKCYNYETIIVYILSTIVGFKKMESLYMKADLKGLVTELNQYIYQNDIIEFLMRLDHINYVMVHKKEDIPLNIREQYQMKKDIKTVHDILADLSAEYLLTSKNYELEKENFEVWLGCIIDSLLLPNMDVDIEVYTKEQSKAILEKNIDKKRKQKLKKIS